VSDWLPYTEGHERWWDAIWRAADERGDQVFTVTTEFGPPNYQVPIVTKVTNFGLVIFVITNMYL
jgi:hypothetical protein